MSQILSLLPYTVRTNNAPRQRLRGHH